MSTRRTWLVGGLSSVHDPMLVAALRGCGKKVEQLHAPTDLGLRRARALGNHGQCNPAHYAVGAVLEHAECSGLDAGTFCEERLWLTLGSRGPCRLAAFPHEYARVLRGAGLGALPVEFVDQLAFVARRVAAPETIDLGCATALLTAIVAGDVVVQISHVLRPYAVDPEQVEQIARRAVAELSRALERQSPVEGPLRELRASAGDIALDPTRVLPRALLVGEPWTTLADGDPSYDLARRLGLHGVEVLAPTATDWLRHRLSEEARPGARATMEYALADATLRSIWSRLTGAAGLDAPLENLDELSCLALPYYDPRVRGGSAHLEVGRALKAVRDGTVHLVLSLKPFGCLPSSSLSDGILSVLLRVDGAPGFLALETTGDSDATVESRVEMAVHTATLRACGEFEAACRSAQLSRHDARRLLEARRPALGSLPTPRTYACGAAERVRHVRMVTGAASP